TGLQRLGDDRKLCLVRPLPPALDAVQHLDAAQPNRLGDVIMDVAMVVSIRAHGGRRSHDPPRSCHVRSRHRLRCSYERCSRSVSIAEQLMSPAISDLLACFTKYARYKGGKRTKGCL